MIHYNHIEIFHKEVYDALVQVRINLEQVPIEVKQ
jgi:hypothetical protein